MKPEGLADVDYIGDLGLAEIHALVPEVAQDFDLDVQAYPKTAQATFRFDNTADVFSRGRSIYALAEAAMWLDALCKNLRAERDENERLRALLP